MDYIEMTSRLKASVIQKRPLIHHITNFVTMYQCARITAFLGASPIMAFASSEAAQIAEKSDALVINTGTLNDEVIRSIPSALAAANKKNIPVVLDPVGIQLSDYRRGFILSLLESFRFSVVRCNAAELLNIYNKTKAGSGIDGAFASPDTRLAAEAVADKYSCVIACTGKTDIICSGRDTILLDRGSSLLPKLVGTGCMVNSLIGAYLPVAPSPLEAGIAGILTMCLAGEAAEAQLKNPEALGSFETLLMDCIRTS